MPRSDRRPCSSRYAACCRLYSSPCLPGAALLITQAARAAEKTTFNVAWSIYVGWMPWDYAQQSGILKKWADKYGITIKLTQMDYIESINQYTAGKFDGCVMTNMDMLTIPAAGGVDSTALIVGDYSERQRRRGAQGRRQEARRHQGPVGEPRGAVGVALPAGARPRIGRARRTRHQGREHLRRGHRQRLRDAGRHRHGDLEAAVGRSHGDAEDHAGVRLEQDRRARSSISWWSTARC